MHDDLDVGLAAQWGKPGGFGFASGETAPRRFFDMYYEGASWYAEGSKAHPKGTMITEHYDRWAGLSTETLDLVNDKATAKIMAALGYTNKMNKGVERGTFKFDIELLTKKGFLMNRKVIDARKATALRFAAAHIETFDGVARQLLFTGISNDIQRIQPTITAIADAYSYDETGDLSEGEIKAYLAKNCKISNAMYNDWKMMVGELRDALLASVPGIRSSANLGKVQAKINALYAYIDTIRSHQAANEYTWALCKYVANPDPTGRNTVRINWDPAAVDHGVVGHLYDLFNDIWHTMLEDVQGLDIDVDKMFSSLRLQTDASAVGGYRDQTVQQTDRAYRGSLTRSMLAWKVGVTAGLDAGWAMMFPELVRTSNVADFTLLNMRQEHWQIGRISLPVSGIRYFQVFIPGQTGTERVGMFVDSTDISGSPLNAGVTFFVDRNTRLPTVTWTSLNPGGILTPPTVTNDQRIDHVKDFYDSLPHAP
jgi:hypothetical protein